MWFAKRTMKDYSERLKGTRNIKNQRSQDIGYLKLSECQCSREFKIPICAGLWYLATKRPTAASAITAAMKLWEEKPDCYGLKS